MINADKFVHLIFLRQPDARRSTSFAAPLSTKNTLTDSWKRAKDVDPSNEFASEFLSPKSSKKNKKKEVIPADIMIEKASISPRLATFTLVHVLKGQELYQRALDVLDILEQKGENKKQIEAERRSIQSHI